MTLHGSTQRRFVKTACLAGALLLWGLTFFHPVGAADPAVPGSTGLSGVEIAQGDDAAAKKKAAEEKKKAEAEAKKAEEARKKAEAGAKKAEEAAKKKAAEEKKKAEAEAKKAEEARKKAEASKAGEEAKKKAQEQARQLDQAKKLLDMKKFDEAESAVKTLLAADPQNKRALSLQKDIIKKREEYKSQAAQTQVKETLKRAEEAAKARQYDRAIQIAEEAAKADPKSKAAQDAVAKYKKAKADYEKDKVKGDVKRELDEAGALLERNQFDPARERVQKALALDATNSDALKLREKIDKTETEFRFKQNESRIKELLAQAEKQRKEGKYAEARKTLEEVEKLNKGDKKAAALLAKVEQDQKKSEAKAVEDRVKAKQSQAEALAKEGKYEEAVALYDELLKEDPQNAKVRELRAKTLKAKDEAAAKAAQAAKKAQEEAAKKAAEEKKKADEAAKKAAAEKAKADAAAAKKAAEEKAKAEAAAKKAEAAKKTTDVAAVPVPADQKKAEEAARKADEEKKKAEAAAAKKAEEEKKKAAEAARKADEEKKKAEAAAAKKAEEEKKKADEIARKAAEEQKKAEEAARKADEEKKKAEAAAAKKAEEIARKAAEEQKKAEEAARKADEEKKKAEAAAAKKAEEEKKKADEAARKAADEQKKAEEAARKKAEEEAKKEVAKPVATPKPEPTPAVQATPKPEPTPKATPKPEATPKPVATPDLEKKAEEERKARERDAERQMRDGDRALERQRFDEAITAYQRALALNPASVEIRTKLETAQARKQEAAQKEAQRGEFNRLLTEARQLADARNYVEARNRVAQAKAMEIDAKASDDLLAQINRMEQDSAAAQAREKVAQGDRLLAQGQFDPAQAAYNEALAILPDFAPAKAGLQKVEETRARAEREKAQAARQQTEQRARALFNEGRTLYNQGKLEEARAKWLEAKRQMDDYNLANPATPVRLEDVEIFLRNTEQEYNRLLSERSRREQFEDRERSAQAKLDTPITYDTKGPQPLDEFMNYLQLITEIDYTLAGVDYDPTDEKKKILVNTSVTDRPLREVLDAVLTPIGMRWERDPGSDLIKIIPDLRTRVIPLRPDEASNIQALLDKGTLQRLLYGGDGSKRVREQEIYVDERSLVLVITDSEQNIRKVENLLLTLKEQTPPGVIWRSYEIQADKGPQIKAMLDAMLRITDPTATEPFQRERQMILEGNLLLLKDSPENIKRAEKILADRDFLAKIYSKNLAIETFNLSPIFALQENSDLVDYFAINVVNMIRTMLYAQTTQSEAAKEGRVLWYHDFTKQLVIVDYPENLAAVGEFIDSLPQIRKKKKSKIIFLKHQTASTLAGQIEDFLGISGAGGPSRPSGRGTMEITKTLRTGTGSGNEFTWSPVAGSDITVRVLRVNDNDVNDDTDNDCELIIRTPGNSQTTTLEIYRTEFVGDFELTAEDIKPSTTSGEGRVKLKIAYRPAGTGGQTNRGLENLY